MVFFLSRNLEELFLCERFTFLDTRYFGRDLRFVKYRVIIWVNMQSHRQSPFVAFYFLFLYILHLCDSVFWFPSAVCSLCFQRHFLYSQATPSHNRFQNANHEVDFWRENSENWNFLAELKNSKLAYSVRAKYHTPSIIEILTYLDATLLRMDRKKRNIRLTDSVYLSDCEKAWRQWLWFEGRKMLIDHHKRRLMTYSCSWIIIYFNKSVHLPLK